MNRARTIILLLLPLLVWGQGPISRIGTVTYAYCIASGTTNYVINDWGWYGPNIEANATGYANGYAGQVSASCLGYCTNAYEVVAGMSFRFACVLGYQMATSTATAIGGNYFISATGTIVGPPNTQTETQTHYCAAFPPTTTGFIGGPC